MQVKEPACFELNLCLRRHDSPRAEHYQAVTIGSTFSDVDLNFSCIFSIVGSVYNFVYFTIRRHGSKTEFRSEAELKRNRSCTALSSHFRSN
jgi:hypothetical protein